MLGISHRRRLIVASVLACAVTALGVHSVSAQAVYGSISGTVRDNSGGVLPGVTVTIRSLERQTTDAVVSNESGFYVKDRLLPGTYEVKAELAGFKQAVYTGVNVSVDTNAALNIALELGEVSEQVTVTGFTPLLRTDRADVATTFESRQLTDLPVLDRNSRSSCCSRRAHNSWDGSTPPARTRRDPRKRW
ncbi:MAG: carboxypeptidase-like regulatory domain-containing protein [Vicinamibacterales bacterium]